MEAQLPQTSQVLVALSARTTSPNNKPKPKPTISRQILRLKNNNKNFVKKANQRSQVREPTIELTVEELKARTELVEARVTCMYIKLRDELHSVERQVQQLEKAVGRFEASELQPFNHSTHSTTFEPELLFD